MSSSHYLTNNGCESGTFVFKLKACLDSFLDIQQDQFKKCIANSPKANNPPHCSRSINKNNWNRRPGLLNKLLQTQIPSLEAGILLRDLASCVVCGVTGGHQVKAGEIYKKWYIKLWDDYLRADGLDPELCKWFPGPLTLDVWLEELETVREEQEPESEFESGSNTGSLIDFMAKSDELAENGENEFGFPTPDSSISVLGYENTLSEASLSPDGTVRNNQQDERVTTPDYGKPRVPFTERLQVYRHPPKPNTTSPTPSCYPSAPLSVSSTTTAGFPIVSSASGPSMTTRHPGLGALDRNALIGQQAVSRTSRSSPRSNTANQETRSPAGDESEAIYPETETREEDIGIGREDDQSQEYGDRVKEIEGGDIEETRGNQHGMSEEKVVYGDEEDVVYDDEETFYHEKTFYDGSSLYDEDNGEIENNNDGTGAEYDATKYIEDKQSRTEEGYSEDIRYSAPGPLPTPTLGTTQGFRVYYRISAEKTLKSLFQAILRYSSPRNRAPGYIYAFSWPDLPGFLKIGYTNAVVDPTRSFPHPVDFRLSQWVRKCGHPVIERFRVYMPCAAERMEQLIHLTLRPYRRIQDPPCEPCRQQRQRQGGSGNHRGGAHNEWFEIDVETARWAVDLWKLCSLQDPYDKYGRVVEFWARRAEEERQQVKEGDSVARWLEGMPDYIEDWRKEKLQQEAELQSTLMAFENLRL